MLIPIDEVVKGFDICTHNPTTGAISDADSTPTFDVFEEDTDTAIVAAQSFTKRTSLTGNYRGSFTASLANGFEAGKWYSVIATATVGGVTAKKNALFFRVAPAEVSAGVPEVNLRSVTAGVIAAAAFAAGALDAVWSTAVRLLTAGTNIALAKGVGLTGLNDLDAAAMRAALGLAAANLDTQLSAEGVKKNAALNNFEFFMADSADHVTGKTGLTVVVTRSIDGTAFVGCTNSPATEVASGVYAINLSAADLNGTIITLKMTAVGADTTLITLKTSL